MTLTHWNSMRELTKTQKQFSTLLNAALHREAFPHAERETWSPAVDVSETAEGYTFAIELPGMTPETVAVEVKDNVLTVKGERKEATLEEGAQYLHRERSYGRFARVFRMTKPVDANGVIASYQHGVLSIAVPLREEARPRKIRVQG